MRMPLKLLRGLGILVALLGCSDTYVHSNFKTDESTVTNGGDADSQTLSRLMNNRVSSGLTRTYNVSILKEQLSEEEISIVQSLAKQPLLISLVSPFNLENNRYFHPNKLNEPLAPGSFLDSTGRVVNGRVVWDVKKQDFAIQIESRFYAKNTPEKKDVSITLLRLLAHELVRLAYYKKLIHFPDDRGELSSRLYFAPLENPFNPILGNRKVTFDGQGYSFGHQWRSPEGHQYEGTLNCNSALPGNWFQKNREGLVSRKCFARIQFEKIDIDSNSGKMAYELFTYPNFSRVISFDSTYSLYDGQDIDIVIPSHLSLGPTNFDNMEMLIFGDVLLVGTASYLYRKDPSAPSVMGKSFFGNYFSELAHFDFTTTGADILFESASEISSNARSSVEIHFLYSGEFHFIGPNIDLESEEVEIVRRNGKYQQLGQSVLLFFDDLETPGATIPTSVHLWLRPDSKGKELITLSGESLLEGQPETVKLASSYSAQTDCQETLFTSFMEQKTPIWLSGKGRTCLVKIEFLSKGLAELMIRPIAPIVEPTKWIRGKYTQAGRHIRITSFREDHLLGIYKLLPNGELCDTFDNIFE